MVSYTPPATPAFSLGHDARPHERTTTSVRHAPHGAAVTCGDSPGDVSRAALRPHGTFPLTETPYTIKSTLLRLCAISLCVCDHMLLVSWRMGVRQYRSNNHLRPFSALKARIESINKRIQLCIASIHGRQNHILFNYSYSGPFAESIKATYIV